ncbi:MAG: serine protease [Taibaiella sp.]|jgi:hypothetical protein
MQSAPSSNEKLSNTQISNTIKPGVCKISTENNATSGFVIDANNGIILTSFHLLGTIKLQRLPFSDPDVFAALLGNGYVDRETRPLPKLLEINRPEEIKLDAGFYCKINSSGSPSPKIYDYRDIPGEPQENTAKSAARNEFYANLYKKHPDLNQHFFKIVAQQKRNREPVLFNTRVEINLDGEHLRGEVYFPNGKNQQNLLNNYAYLDALPIKITHFSDGSRFEEGLYHLETGDDVIFLPASENPDEGEKVYYAGFPLEQEEYTFGRGIISSVTNARGRNEVVVEGTILIGASGGPAFIRQGNRVACIGIISSEVTYMTEQLSAIQTKLQTMQEMISLGDLKVVDTLREITTVLLKNMSTGIARVVRIDSDTLYNDTIDRGPDLAKMPTDFLVGKDRVKTTKKELIPLYQYVNTHNITRLNMADLVNYFVNHVDTSTREAVFAEIGPDSKNKSSYISIPTTTLTNDLFIANAQKSNARFDAPNPSIITGNAGEKKKLEALYVYAVQAGQGLIKEGVFQYGVTRNTPVHETHYITLKFHDDHTAGETKKETKAASKDIANHRSVTTSSVLSKNDLEQLSQEVQAAQEDYKKAEQAALAQAKGVVKGLFFLSRNDYSLHTERNDDSSRTRTPFYYSVVKLPEPDRNRPGNTYYLHHFAGTPQNTDVKKNEWTQVEGIKSQVYYKK